MMLAKQEKTQRPTPINRDLFKDLASICDDPFDPYYYRIDSVGDWENLKSTGFNLPRKYHTNSSDEESMGEILRSLPADQGLYRLGWWINWRQAANWIYTMRSDEKLVVTRIKKTSLQSVPGIYICEDKMLRGRAVLTYVIEALGEQNHKFSTAEIPFELTEYLFVDFGWYSAMQQINNYDEIESHVIRFHFDYLAIDILLRSLANGASQIWHLIRDRDCRAFEYGSLAIKALKNGGINPGRTDPEQVLLALLKASGSEMCDIRPDPSMIGKRLLVAVCLECAKNCQPWTEGEAELRRRNELRGLPALIWNLRDMGLMKMKPELRARGSEARFTWE